MANCSKCSAHIVEEDKVRCSICNSDLHFGCAGIQEATFRKMGAKKNSWKCFACRANPSKPNEKKPEDTMNMDEYSKLEILFKSHSNQISNKMDEFRKKLDQYEDSIQYNSNQMEDMMKMFKEVKEENKKIIEKQEVLEKENTELQKRMKILENKIDFLENRSRIENLESQNVPETKNENVSEIVERIGKVIGINNIPEGTIQVAHRVDKMNKERGNRPIIAHMSSRYMRNIWIQKYREFKKGNGGNTLNAGQLDSTLGNVPIYINEHLTIKKKLILKACKSFASENRIQHVWVKDSYILMKKNNEDKRVQKINSEEELEKFKSNFSKL